MPTVLYAVSAGLDGISLMERTFASPEEALRSFLPSGCLYAHFLHGGEVRELRAGSDEWSRRRSPLRDAG